MRESNVTITIIYARKQYHNYNNLCEKTLSQLQYFMEEKTVAITIIYARKQYHNYNNLCEKTISQLQ